jgi:hypothetical protein
MYRSVVIPLAFLVLLTACGSDPYPMTACTAGSSTACNCTDGRSGAQVCNSAGSGYGVCECGTPMDGGMPDAGRLCVPGATQTCSCAGGASGTQACNGAGSAYGPCECAPPTCTVNQTGATFTDTCASPEICVCPSGEAECTDGRCGGIDGRTFSFLFSGYAAPMLDLGGNCYDDIFTPCDDPPDLQVGAAIGGVGYGPVTATDTPTLSGGTWSGSFGGAGFTAPVGMARTYGFVWVDVDTDANDAIGEATGTLSNEVLRGRVLDIGPAGNGFIVFAIPR